MKGLILTYLFTAAGAIRGLRHPLFGLYVYVGLAVLVPQAIFGYAGDLSGLSQIVGVAFLLGWAFRGFGSWHFGGGRRVVVALLLFVAWFILSALVALEPTRALNQVVVFSKLFLPVLVGVTMMEGEKDWRPLLWTIVLCQGYVAFEMNLTYLTSGRNPAADGFAGMDNNCFGVSLICVLGPAIALMLTSKTWVLRGLAGICAALILHTILLTHSRGAMVGLLAVAVTAVITMPKRPLYMAGLAVTILLAVRFTGPELAARYATAFVPAEERDGSAESRVDLWRDCLKVIEQYPMFGVGPANWRVIALSYGWSEGKSAHSVWMETAADVGIPGVLALMSFFGLAAARLWPIARARVTETNRSEVTLATGVILSIVGFCVAGQFVSVPALEVPYYITMLGAAMLKTRTQEAAVRVPANVTGVRTAYPLSPPLRQLSRQRSASAAKF